MYKKIILTILLLLCGGITYYFYFLSHTDFIFSHIFYIPIVLAAFWWGRKGIWIGVCLGILLMVFHFFSNLNTPFLSDAIRFVMFVTIGLIVGLLRENALHSEKKLKETQDYLNNLIHCANAPIVVWDKDGKITLFNTAFERLTGYQTDEVIGKPFTILFGQNAKDKSLKKIEHALKNQYEDGIEIPILCKNGKERILLWNFAKVYASDGETLIATIGQGQDITLRKEAEEALHLKIKGLENHGRVKESMLEQQMKELAAYERIIDAMLRTLDLDKRLEIGLKELMNLTGAEKAGVSIKENDRLVIRKQFGFSEVFTAWAGDLAIEDVTSLNEITVGWNNIPDPSSKLEVALKKERVKSWATVPLRSEQGFFGILILASEKPEAFLKEQINILSALANRFTLMLEQANLYRIAQERLARLTTLREIDSAISANLSMEGIIEIVLRKVSPHIWVDAVGISLIDWERKRTILARLHLPGDVNIEGEAFRLSESLLAQLGIEKKPVIIYDIKSDPRVQNHRDIARKYNLSSYVGVPLVVQDKAIGVLHLFTVEPKKFSHEDLDFFVTMAGQAAISVQNARLYEEATRRAENMEALAKVTFNFTQVSHEKQLAEQILVSACETTGAEMGALFWYKENENSLELLAGIGIPDKVINHLKEMQPLPVEPRAGLLGLVASTRRSIYVPNISKEPSLEFLENGSAYIVPLVYREHLFGVYIFLSKQIDAFSPEQRALADTFVGYVSTTLENARLFKETQKAYEELKATQEQLIQAQKMEAIGRLAGGIAHDFNNLLTSIQGFAELALIKLKEDHPVYYHIKEIQRNAMRAANLTRQLLLFSRKQPMELRPICINTIIKDMMKMLNRLIGEDITLKTELADSLWTVKADAGSIEQVIMNLVVNARDAMPKGGEILIKTENVHIDKEYVKTHTEARIGNFICLSVKDQGIGMDKNTLAHIFEPFFTTKEPGIGTGLGLAVVYGIVKQHEGWIEVETLKGKGTTFKIYLPAVFIGPIEEEKTITSLSSLKGKGEWILLVEDDESVREFAKKGLSENGYIVFTARNAKEAFDIFEKNRKNFALIFSDVVLPDGNGLELAERCFRLKPKIKIVFASGYSNEKIDWEVIQGYRYIQKPYSLSELLKIVKNTLEE